MLAAGQTLDFGQLKLNQTGLWIKPDAPLAWADVAQITSESEHLKIKANGKWLHWFSAPLGTIPNGHVFLQVAEYCRAQPGGVFAASGAPAEFPAPFAGTLSAGNQGAGNANAVWGTTTPATPTSMMSRPMQIITGVFLCFLGLIFISVMISLSKQRNNNAFVITFFMAMGMLAVTEMAKTRATSAATEMVKVMATLAATVRAMVVATAAAMPTAGATCAAADPHSTSN